MKTEKSIADILDQFEESCGLDDIFEEVQYFDNFGFFRVGRHRDDVPDWFRRIERYLGGSQPREVMLLHLYRYIAKKAMERLDDINNQDIPGEDN